VSTTITRRVPLLDLQAQHRLIREEVLVAVTRVIDSQHFILGEEVSTLEREIAAYCECEHAVGCASGSDALILALTAAGVGSGDKVLTTPYTFFATAGAISHVGATPVFIDVDERTFNIDVEQAVDTLSTGNVRAVIPVHLFGGCADMDPLLEAADTYGVAVIEDAAQSIGSEYKGRRAGSLGKVGCFSFFPSKNLGGFGDGGMLTTRDATVAGQLMALRAHGGRKKYFHEMVGYNSRLDALQAAVLRVKLQYLDGWSAGRSANADRYRARIAEMQLPLVPAAPAPYQNRHIYNQFIVRSEKRDALQQFLKERGIGSEVYYPLPMHLQPCYAFLGYSRGAFPVSERLAQESLALPIHSELATGDIDYVCETLRAFFR
jgi:dTDP-4-amino-4,6-dideoxygalactose transaminase